MTAILVLARAFVSRNGLALAAIAGLLATALTYDRSRVNHGRSVERAAVEKRTAENVQAAEKVRAEVRRRSSAAKPAADGRVRNTDPNARD